MGDLEVRCTDDPNRALNEACSYLHRHPVENNRVLSLLHERHSLAGPGRYWTVLNADRAVGVAVQAPAGMPLQLTAMSPAAARAVAAAIPGDLSLPAVVGEAGTAAAFAGMSSELRSERVRVSTAQRLYRLVELSPPVDIPGTLRQARQEDRDLLTAWMREFVAETDAPTPATPDELLARFLAADSLYVWEDGGVVSMARATPGTAGVSRIGFVFTPSELRGRGYAAACVRALSQHLRDAVGLDCVLYTELANPISNRLYRRLGYCAVAEVLGYEFTASQDTW